MIIQNGSTPRIVFLLVDATDYETAETGLTPTVQISKNGGSFANTTNSAVEIGNGWYYVALTATETNTDGPLVVRATGTGAAEWRDYHQVETTIPADVQAIDGSADAAEQQKRLLLTAVFGTVAASSTTTVIKTTGLSGNYANDRLNGRTLYFLVGSSIEHEATVVEDYDDASGDITVTALTAAPSAADTFVII